MDGFGFVGVLFVIAVFPAVMEETVFRGLILKGLRQSKEIYAVLLCGALFALYHQKPEQTVYQFCCGAAFALVALRSGSVLPTVVAHFINNAWILIMTKFSLTLDAIYTPFLIIPFVLPTVSFCGTDR
jgi:membrane protease YdiL (CAAX protease family)